MQGVMLVDWVQPTFLLSTGCFRGADDDAPAAALLLLMSMVVVVVVVVCFECAYRACALSSDAFDFEWEFNLEKHPFFSHAFFSR